MGEVRSEHIDFACFFVFERCETDYVFCWKEKRNGVMY